MSALASGADWLFIPESPPEDGWENFMCERLGEVSATLCLPLWGPPGIPFIAQLLWDGGRDGHMSLTPLQALLPIAGVE